MNSSPVSISLTTFSFFSFSKPNCRFRLPRFHRNTSAFQPLQTPPIAGLIYHLPRSELFNERNEFLTCFHYTNNFFIFFFNLVACVAVCSRRIRIFRKCFHRSPDWSWRTYARANFYASMHSGTSHPSMNLTAIFLFFN